MTSTTRRNTIHHSSQSSLHSSQASSRYAGKSKRTVAFDPKYEKAPVKKPTVQVVLDGVDVTPRSLIGADAGSPVKSSNKPVINFNESASIAAPSDLLNQSMFGGSAYQASYAAGFSKSIMSSMISSRASLDSVTDEISEPVSPKTNGGLQEKIEQREHSEKAVDLSEADLEKIVNITLEETDTLSLLDIPGVAVSLNDENVTVVKEANEAYNQLCANRRGNDRYVERGMQTFDNASKNKEMQTTKVESNDQACMATNWDIYDTYNAKEEIEEGEEGDDDLLTFTTANPVEKRRGSMKGTPSTLTLSMASQTMSGTQNFSGSVMSESSSFSNSTVLVDESEEGSIAIATIDLTGAQMEKVMKMESFKENLFIMERTVVQNQYHSKQAAYRGLSDLKLFSHVEEIMLQEEEEEETSKCPNFYRLWSYECQFTRGMSVTFMVWNKENPDLLAVGYSKNGFAENGKGLVCVWSINNPEHPERIYEPSCAVTAIDFSKSRPYLLAVGLFNGTIVLYNIQNSADKPVLDTVDSPGKHFRPIWQLKWVEREKGTGEDRGEVLVSSSGDARVTQWTISKGFEYADLMKLKRTSNALQHNSKKTNTKKDNAFISRYTSGMCFNFHTVDGNIYIAGTEDGHIHRCSCSYNEQYLETYIGHRGPVYRACWSPFNPNIFLTCSADWNIGLWHVDKTNPILMFQAAAQSVIDIDWSPMSSVVFVACSEQQVELWDLSSSVLDPLIVHLPVTNVKLTSVKFALNSKALVVGDSDGHATIYQLNQMNWDDDRSTAQPLLKVIQSNLPERSTKVSLYDVDSSNNNNNDSNNDPPKDEFVER